MTVRRPRVPQRRDETLPSLGRVTQRNVMARGLRSNPGDMRAVGGDRLTL
jgi:hypothetical protein